jgi:hypothetical protein
VTGATDDHHMSLPRQAGQRRFRVWAYLTFVGWYLIALVALAGWEQWETARQHARERGEICTDCGFGDSLTILGVVIPVVISLVLGAVVGQALVAGRIASAEPGTRSRSVGVGTAMAWLSFLAGLAGTAALCALGYVIALVHHLLS